MSPWETVGAELVGLSQKKTRGRTVAGFSPDLVGFLLEKAPALWDSFPPRCYQRVNLWPLFKGSTSPAWR